MRWKWNQKGKVKYSLRDNKKRARVKFGLWWIEEEQSAASYQARTIQVPTKLFL